MTESRKSCNSSTSFEQGYAMHNNNTNNHNNNNNNNNNNNTNNHFFNIANAVLMHLSRDSCCGSPTARPA